MKQIANEIRSSADYIMKMDTDEFLTVYDKNSKTLKPSLSEYMSDYVTNETHPLRLLNGTDARIAYVQSTFPSKKICDEDKYATPEKFPLSDVESVKFEYKGALGFSSKPFKDYKGLWDSSIVFDGRRMNLGGHAIGVGKETWIDLGIIHVHSRCYEIEIENILRVILSHGYIDAKDNDEQKMTKLVRLVNCNIDDVCNTCTMNRIKQIASFHKVAFYLQHLGCPEKTMNSFYNHSKAIPNDDFVKTLQELEEKYAL